MSRRAFLAWALARPRAPLPAGVPPAVVAVRLPFMSGGQARSFGAARCSARRATLPSPARRASASSSVRTSPWDARGLRPSACEQEESGTIGAAANLEGAALGSVRRPRCARKRLGSLVATPAGIMKKLAKLGSAMAHGRFLALSGGPWCQKPARFQAAARTLGVTRRRVGASFRNRCSRPGRVWGGLLRLWVATLGGPQWYRGWPRAPAVFGAFHGGGRGRSSSLDRMRVVRQIR